jgi:hypothetical protein
MVIEILYNTAKFGSQTGFKKEKNKFKNYFDENNRLNILLNLFKYLISQTLSPIWKEIIICISIVICLLLKNEKPPLCYGCVLEYVNDFKASPSSTSGVDYPSAPKKVWNGMLNADGCLLENFSV